MAKQSGGREILAPCNTVFSRQSHTDVLKRAQEELNENPEDRDHHVDILREMILTEETLKSRTDDNFLLRFLRARKFEVDRSFKLLKNYHKIREKYPDLFKNYRPSSLYHAMNEKVLFMLPYRDQEGRRIFLIRAGRWDPSTISPDDCHALIHMCIDHVLREEETQVNGLVLVCDLKNFGFLQGLHATPSNCMKTAAILQDCLPARFKGFHALNEPAIFHLCFLVIKPFLNNKFRSRVHFHGDNLESLHQHIYPEFLPEEYGGQQPSAEQASAWQVQGLMERDDEIANDIVTYGYRRNTS